MSTLRLRRTFLFLVIGSLALAALLGVAALILDPGFGDVTGRTVATALTITLFSTVSLACAWAWERGRRRGLAVVGLALSGISFLVFVSFIWGVGRYLSWQREEFVARIMGLGVTWTILTTLLCLLALARLRRGWMWVSIATQVAAVLLAALISLAIVVEPHDADYFRFMGVIGILTACGTICVPILHRLSAMPVTDQVVTTKLVLTLICPRCETQQEMTTGHAKCCQCGLKLHIEIEEEHCSNCGYVLYKLTSDRCPECGTPIAARPASRGVVPPPQEDRDAGRE